MNNGLFGWPGSLKVVTPQSLATNDLGARQLWTGSTTWVVPAGVTRIRASALGGGCGGTGAYYSGTGPQGAGGGGGLFLRGWLNVTPGVTLTITVGAGGAGGAGGTPANTVGVAGAVGGASRILQSGVTLISASGGISAEQSLFYFEGTPLAVVNGKAGSGWANSGGGGGGGGGLSAQNTAGDSVGNGGYGSLGMLTPAGTASLPGLPESGGGGNGGLYVVGYAGLQGSGGGGGGWNGTSAFAGGAGGGGFVMVEY